MKEKIGCLLVHGFGGGPGELEPLAKFLESKGMQTLLPVLKGHTGKRADIKGVSYRDWVQSGEAALKELLDRCNCVFVIGFSMGGLVAVSLPPFPQIKGLVLLNTPIYPWNLKRILLNLVEDMKRRHYGHFRFYVSCILKFPLSALIEFVRFLRAVKPRFREVHTPLFIAQALQDDVVQPRSAEYIHRHASSLDKTLKYYDGSAHLICHSEARFQLFEDILAFIQKCCS